MSVQSDIHGFLSTIAKGATDGKFVPMDPGKVAEQVGVNRNKVNKTLFNLVHSGKIELQRGEDGRRIVGFKMLAEPSPPRVRRIENAGRQRLARPALLSPEQARTRRRSLPTPHLDEYAASKAKFERLTEELGDFVQAEFNENPYAEEGLALRERLQHIEGNWADLITERDELRRDLRALRGRVNRELAESIEANGQSVKGGD